MTVGLNTFLKTVGVAKASTTPNVRILDRNIYGEPAGSGYQQYPQHYYQSHGSSKKGGKHSIALTALTLLAFLFFLNILQNCIQEQHDMNQSTPQIMVLSSRLKQPREAEKRKGEEPEEINADDLTKSDETYDGQEDNGKTYLQIAKRILETRNSHQNDELMSKNAQQDEN